MVQAMIKGKEQQQNESPKDTKKASTKEIVLEAELDQVKKELADVQARENYWKKSYTISRLTAEVIRMETGLPTREVFDIVVNHALRFKDSITHFSGWKVESITFEDQIFMTLMKIRRSYTNLHLAQLFSCSVGTIANIVTTFIHVLHSILFQDTCIMTSVPPIDKNKLFAPSSFSQFTSCRMVIDCTDIEVAAPSLVSQQNATYSGYRSMNSFKGHCRSGTKCSYHLCKQVVPWCNF